MSPGISRSGGGPTPTGNGSQPIHDCTKCGAMYSGGSHTCRQISQDADREAGG
jgi:hypothetical protein